VVPLLGKFREIERIETLARVAPKHVRLETLTTVRQHGKTFPLYALTLGSADRTRPVFGLFAGVHGIERVGVHVALAFLESFVSRLSWDKETRRSLNRARIVSIPPINPVGFYFLQRHNSAGVDLMRNAPVESEHAFPLLGGQRLHARLPWFRGTGQLEPESAALVAFVRREMFDSRAALSLDIHSGFGFRDRLWFPYARTREDFPDIRAVAAFANLLDRTYRHNIYKIESQSESYCTHGDLWDYLYDQHRAEAAQPATEVETDPPKRRLFLPFTLEIGSWIWIRKNPRQLLRAEGAFNPLKPHRHSRTMRRHLGLLDFCFRAARNHRRWVPEPE
jgi:hypothetical protein